jgi:hypothetical protein
MQPIAAYLVRKDSIGEALYGSTVDTHTLINHGNPASLAPVKK